jgi:hypothetical protein
MSRMRDARRPGIKRRFDDVRASFLPGVTAEQTMGKELRVEKDLYDYERDLSAAGVLFKVEKDHMAKDPKRRGGGTLQLVWTSPKEGERLFRSLLRGLQAEEGDG